MWREGGWGRGREESRGEGGGKREGREEWWKERGVVSGSGDGEEEIARKDGRGKASAVQQS